MLKLENARLLLAVSPDGMDVVLEDKTRRCRWRLDNARREYRLAAPTRGAAIPLPAPSVAQGKDVITLRHALAAGGTISYEWRLAADCAEIRLTCDAPDVGNIALPGMMLPEQGAWDVAVPILQGLLMHGPAAPWEAIAKHGGHTNFSMAMGGMLADKAGLLIVHDSPCNWWGVYGQDARGPIFHFEHFVCPVDGWRGATVRLYPCAADLTSLCKAYRGVLKGRGQFVSWKEKLAAKPMLADLFGGMMTFVGYNQSKDTDYVGCTRQLKKLGFDTLFLYPLRLCHWSMNLQMGGDTPIWRSDEELSALKAIPGVHLSPWLWMVESLQSAGPQMQALYRRHSNGEPVAGWQMDDNTYYRVCSPYQIEPVQKRMATDMAAMDWVHFDVSSNQPTPPCFSREHALHGNKPIGPLDDMKNVRQLLSPQTMGQRIISSEGFSDFYATAYDIGSTKFMPAAGCDGSRVPVPMTMLVLHDSCVHDWWEVENYNLVPGFGTGNMRNGLGRYGSGLPHLKAAIDALMGCPPNVFPFGRMYAWVDKVCGKTYSFQIRLEDAPVQEALAAALPVAKLHKRTGPCELMSVEFLSDDRLVQRTTFSDGTRVVANLSDVSKDVPGVGPMAGQSWKEMK
jgi:hypothetical protein